MVNLKLRVGQLLRDMGQGLYEKETELGLGLLAALAGESILLLGPPGIAKSMVSRRLSGAFACARTFEYLMSRFSTPDEIFGPVSISRLKANDCYERATDGYLPSADVAFLDEIWKAGPAIQNTLLTIINEKRYLNGNRMMQVPLKLLVAASNELPTQGEGLEALWDRFLVRVMCQPIGQERNFRQMLRNPLPTSPRGGAPFTQEEYAEVQQMSAAVTVPDEVLDVIQVIRQRLQDVAIEGEDVHRRLYVSDRRWKKIVGLMRTSAVIHDRREVQVADLMVAVPCLWNEPEEIRSIARIVAEAIVTPWLEGIRKYDISDMRNLDADQIRRKVGDADARINEIESLFQGATIAVNGIKQHMFANPETLSIITSQMDVFKKQVARARAVWGSI